MCFYEKEQQYRLAVCPQDLSYEGLEHILDISHRCVMCNLVRNALQIQTRFPIGPHRK